MYPTIHHGLLCHTSSAVDSNAPVSWFYINKHQEIEVHNHMLRHVHVDNLYRKKCDNCYICDINVGVSEMAMFDKK